MKLYTYLSIALLSVFAANATSVIVTNNRGPTATREIVPSSLTLTAGFGAFGFLSDAAINGASTTFAGLNFNQYGNGGGAVTTSTSGQFSFTDNLNINTTGAAFADKNIYLVVGFGGTNLATSTELFIYKFAGTFGSVDSGIPITQTLSSSPGSILLGGTTGGDPNTSAAARYTSVALIPETSTTLLGAFGALALLRRRRN